MLSILGDLNTREAVTKLRFSDGRIVSIPTAMLEVEQGIALPDQTQKLQGDEVRVPLVAEQMDVTKQTVVTGRVLLEKTVEAYDVTVDEPLAVTSWTVERVPLGHVVQTVPAVREEYATTIYPILEERMVLTKELILVEEIRVTRAALERQVPQTFTLRRENLQVRREDYVAE